MDLEVLVLWLVEEEQDIGTDIVITQLQKGEVHIVQEVIINRNLATRKHVQLQKVEAVVLLVLLGQKPSQMVRLVWNSVR